MSDPSAGSLSPPTELLWHDRAVIVAALAGLTVIAWFYTWLQVRVMTGIEDMAMPAEFGPWTMSDVALNVVI
jgi:predicted metal-binding membrane protein